MDDDRWDVLMHPGQKMKPGTRPCSASRPRNSTPRCSRSTRSVDGRFASGVPRRGTVAEVVDAIGHMPLPPYIKRDDVGGSRALPDHLCPPPGSVAAPTAGLHLTSELLDGLAHRGVDRAEVTLHVGYGTFEPVRTDVVEEHRLHPEPFEIDAAAATAIATAQREGRRIVSVGTTTTRTLEAVAAEYGGIVHEASGEASLFIHPGFRFQVAGGLLTNFHLPKSSLLLLVCAFAGTELTLAAYRHAIADGYRFYSYGDAMLVCELVSAWPRVRETRISSRQSAIRFMIPPVKFPYDEFDLSGVRTYPLATRSSKARAEDFARPYRKGDGIAQWVASLPRILAGGDFKAVVDALIQARRSGGGIIWGFGAHVLKTGLSPVLVDLMRRGYVSAMATNGAGIIHDFEIALAGSTSEDVDEALGPGRFGMAEETGRDLNHAIADGVGRGLGIGQAVGQYSALARRAACAPEHRGDRRRARHTADGARCHWHRRHPHAPFGVGGCDWNREPAGFQVFRVERRAARGRDLPELRLGGRPAGGVLEGRGACAKSGPLLERLDDRQHRLRAEYRPQTNVVTRPTRGIGTGYSLIGHHELLIPLLAAALIDAEPEGPVTG